MPTPPPYETGGGGYYSGRLEVRRSGVPNGWTTVCDDSWTDTNAMVRGGGTEEGSLLHVE